MAEASEGGKDLFKFSLDTPGSDAWLSALDDADTRSIIAAISKLGTVATDRTPTQIAYREAARSMVEQKLTDRMISEMKRLERIGVYVAIVGLSIAIPGAVIAGIQLCILIKGNQNPRARSTATLSPTAGASFMTAWSAVGATGGTSRRRGGTMPSSTNSSSSVG
jgi:hypothetical protein